MHPSDGAVLSGSLRGTLPHVLGRCAVGALRVSEGAKYAVVPITMTGSRGLGWCSVAYRTRASEGPNAATAGEDYVHTEGTLRFAPLRTKDQIYVPLKDDDIEEVHAAGWAVGWRWGMARWRRMAIETALSRRSGDATALS